MSLASFARWPMHFPMQNHHKTSEKINIFCVGSPIAPKPCSKLPVWPFLTPNAPLPCPNAPFSCPSGLLPTPFFAFPCSKSTILNTQKNRKPIGRATFPSLAAPWPPSFAQNCPRGPSMLQMHFFHAQMRYFHSKVTSFAYTFWPFHAPNPPF